MAKKPHYLSKSLETLRSQVNEFAPQRSKASDGWIGDAAHASRKSDHNPDEDGSVDAIDITHDPKGGVDCAKLLTALINSKDRRISYMIFNGKIVSGHAGTKPWVRRNYTGKNKHTQHLHISVLDKNQDDTTRWQIDSAFEGVVPLKDIYDGNVHNEVMVVQERLDALGYPEVGAFDGRWGNRTRAAVLAFRADNGLPLVPLIDEQLLASLMTAKKRPIAPKRENATVADLRKEGAEDVQAADVTQIAGGVASAGGVIVAADKVLGEAEQYSGLMGRALQIIEPIKDFVTDNMWLLLIGVGIFVIWKSGVLKNIRLQKHQTGNDVSA